MGLTDSYSGVVLNQNATTNTTYAWRDTHNGAWVYQTFNLPANYMRGSNQAEQRIPDLSGFQVFVSIDPTYAASASLSYVLQYFEGNDVGWSTLVSDTVIGAHADGSYVWFDVLFDQSVPIPATLLKNQYRIGMQIPTMKYGAYAQPVAQAASGAYLVENQGYTANLVENVPYPIQVGGLDAFLLLQDTVVTWSYQQGIRELWYVSPTPILGKAFQADGVTPLLGVGTTACLNFRILGLTADSGTDFLNNEYRSVVVQSSPGNTDTTKGLNPVTGSGQGNYWMSPPQPSPFAVQSLYFDVRPVPETAQYGIINVVGNPSFEYDPIGHAPGWWLSYNNGVNGTVVDQAVRNTWTYDKQQSLHMSYTFTALNQAFGVQSPMLAVSPTTGGQATPVSMNLHYSLVTATGSKLFFNWQWYDTNQVALSSGSSGTTTLGTGTLGSAGGTVPANAAYVRFTIMGQATAASGSLEAYVDAVQITWTTSNPSYFDGDSSECAWTAQRGNSPSVQVIAPTVDDDFVVLDGVLVDPVTPNMAFNVYYSEDDAYTSTKMTETDWEQKLWTRVPEVYLCTQRQQYMFPEPIHAKYVKIEFTNLPAQSYDPGPFQKPVSYKKFPTWVANFFLAMLTPPSFVASQVNVHYDALSFAYDYYLDDLDQAPAMPTAPPTGVAQQLTSYFANNQGDPIDATTLARINLAMKPYQNPQSAQVDTSTLLGQWVQNIMNPTTMPATAEGVTSITDIDYSAVSSSRRESVVLEQSLPVMFFFLTCRHSYKELKASFDYNRAYFAGVNDIAFLRNDYTVAADTPLYIESGGDPANVQYSDWVLDTDKNWYTYGS